MCEDVCVGMSEIVLHAAQKKWSVNSEEERLRLDSCLCIVVYQDFYTFLPAQCVQRKLHTASRAVVPCRYLTFHDTVMDCRRSWTLWRVVMYFSCVNVVLTN